MSEQLDLERRAPRFHRVAAGLAFALVAALVGCVPEAELPHIARAPDFVLSDPRLLRSRKEFPDDVTATIQALFPNIIVQAQSNTLAMRHAVPKGVGRTELIWTFFGYADDDEEINAMRLRQANLMGVSGYVTVDDAEVLEFSQVGLSGAPGDAAAVLELGGRDTGSHDHMVTESLIRGFYARYRDIMDMAQGPGA